MRGLLYTSAAIAAIAVLLPSLFTRYMESGGHFGARPPAHEAMLADPDHLGDSGDIADSHDAKQAPSGRQHTVRAARDGHFYIDARVNRAPVRFIVDTGATVVALRQSDAASAGIHVWPVDFKHPVRTANGTTQAAEAKIRSVSIDDIEVRDVRALVLPDDQLSISLLGGSFLHGVERFEVAGGTLVIEN